MLKWIKMLNKMYEENPCTCNGRVQVTHNGDLNIVIVKVFNNYKVIEFKDYTDWGMLNKVQDIVREMYEAV